MLRERKLTLLTELVKDATPEELIWLNGYLSGLTSTKENITETHSVSASAIKITIAYGTETGNSKKLAQVFAAKAKKQNVQAKVVGLDQYRLNHLEKENYFLLILSTHGDGEPPLAAKKFYDYIHSHEGSLSKLKYSVLALGDSAYPLFCKAGEDADQRLSKLGGQRIAQVQKCD